MSFTRVVGFILAVTLFFCACKKPILDDTALIPNDRINLKYTDTLTVRAYSVREDSVEVSSCTLSTVGFMDDPDFGKTTAGFYLPFLLKSDSIIFDDGDVVLDSVVLYLRYYSVYGDWSWKNYPQNIKAYEMTEGIVDSLTYYSNQTFEIDPVPVGEITDFTPNSTDSVTIGGLKYPPLFRMKLSKIFGQKFIDASGLSSYYNDDNFSDFFKGLYITGSKQNGGKGIVSLNPNSIFSRLVVYYHDLQDTSKSVDFQADPSAFVNHYEHDYTGSTVEPFRNNPNVAEGDSLIFIQGLAGTNVKFEIPYLGNLGEIIINKAELVLTQIPSTGSDTVFKGPSVLTMLKSDDDGNFNGVTADQVFPTSVFGGQLKTETDSSGTYTRYRFSLSRYYQKIVIGDPDFGIFILPTDLLASQALSSDILSPSKRRNQIPGRIVAGGGSHSKYALKLNLIYTLVE